MAPAEKPDFSFRGFRVTWERATWGILVTAEERTLPRVLRDLTEALERYASESKLLLFIPGQRKPFRGEIGYLASLKRLLTGSNIPDQEEFALYREVFGSVVLLVTPAAFSEVSSETREFLEVGVLRAAATVWRYARPLSFAAFAVLPDSTEFFSAFPEVCSACTRIRYETETGDPVVTAHDTGIGKGVRFVPDSEAG